MSDASKAIPLTVVGSLQEGVKQLGGDKIARSPVKFDEHAPTLRKPSWIRVRIPAGQRRIWDTIPAAELEGVLADAAARLDGCRRPDGAMGFDHDFPSSRE